MPDATPGTGGGPWRRPGVVLLFAIGVAGFLAPMPFEPRYGRLFNLLGNAAHLPILAAYTAGLYALGFARRNPAKLALAGAGTAALLEVAQSWVGRTASVTDWVAGCLGVACTLAAVWVWRPGRGAALRWGHGLLTLCLTALTLVPAWNEWRAIRWREQTFPVLADFEDDRDLLSWEVRGGTRDRPSSFARSDTFASSGKTGLRVTLGAGSRASLVYAAGFQNWKPYRTLRFDLFNPGPPFPLGLFIQDRGDGTAPGSRYYRRFDLKTGLNEFRLPISEIRSEPASRPLDLAEIAWVTFVPRIGESPRDYFLDSLRLE